MVQGSFGDGTAQEKPGPHVGLLDQADSTATRDRTYEIQDLDHEAPLVTRAAEEIWRNRWQSYMET
jgi:hypothetical protein